MDLLSDLLREAGLQRRRLDLRRIDASRALRFPCDRSIGLHVVVQGDVFVHAPNLTESLPLQAGDIAVMARGCTHVLSTLSSLQGVTVAPIHSMPVEQEQDPADTAVTQVISAAFQLWNCPVHPFFAEMPDWFVLRSHEIPRLGPIALTLGLLQEETQRPSLGSETIVQGLLDTVFTFLLREMAHRFSHGGVTGWSHAALDPQIRKVLSLLHTHCEAGWTLEKLASEVGVSRTSLAERFRNAMGDTPLNYLRTLRIQKAMRLLGDTDWSLETIAGRVGYQDAFSFSKVFKRVTGSSPRDFRNRDRQEQQLDWRFRPT